MGTSVPSIMDDVADEATASDPAPETSEKRRPARRLVGPSTDEKRSR